MASEGKKHVKDPQEASQTKHSRLKLFFGLDFWKELGLEILLSLSSCEIFLEHIMGIKGAHLPKCHLHPLKKEHPKRDKQVVQSPKPGYFLRDSVGIGGGGSPSSPACYRHLGLVCILRRRDDVLSSGRKRDKQVTRGVEGSKRNRQVSMYISMCGIFNVYLHEGLKGLKLW